MKLMNMALVAGLLLAVSTSGAEAITFEFSCTGDQSNSQCTQEDSGGSTTSAILEFTQTAGDTIEVVVDNTSPIDFAPDSAVLRVFRRSGRCEPAGFRRCRLR